MKEQKKFIYLNGILTLISFVIFIVSLFCEFSCWEIIKSISEAIFISSILSLTYNIIGFITSKEKQLFDYYCIINEFKNCLFDILNWISINKNSILNIIGSDDYKTLCDSNIDDIINKLKLDKCYTLTKEFAIKVEKLRLDINERRYLQFINIKKGLFFNIKSKGKNSLQEILYKLDNLCDLICLENINYRNKCYRIQDIINEKNKYFNLESFYNEIIDFFIQLNNRDIVSQLESLQKCFLCKMKIKLYKEEKRENANE